MLTTFIANLCNFACNYLAPSGNSATKMLNSCSLNNFYHTGLAHTLRWQRCNVIIENGSYFWVHQFKVHPHTMGACTDLKLTLMENKLEASQRKHTANTSNWSWCVYKWHMYSITLFKYSFVPILALLDSVSRAHGMGLVWGDRRLHSQSVSQLSQNLLNAVLSNFSSRLPWGWTRVEMDTFEKNSCFLIFFWWIIQFCINIIPYGRKNFKTLLRPQITFESFQAFFWIFFSVDLTKLLSWVFEILRFWFFMIFFVFIYMGAYGSKNFKTLLLPQITFEFFRTSEFSSQWSAQNYCLEFLKFWLSDF